MSKHVVIATGGTGGHIYPALTFANALVKRDATIKITFVGSNQRMEKDIIPSYGYSFFGLDLIVPNGNVIKKAKAGVSLLKATQKMKLFFKKNPCDLIVGFGNYIEYPVIHGANDYNIPYILHEQNAIVGKANLMLSKRAKCLMLSYPPTQNIDCDYVVTGNPRSYEAIQELKNDPLSAKDYGFKHNYPIVTIVMGSLGSSSINALLNDCIDLFAKRKINYILVSGKNSGDSLHYADQYDNIRMFTSVDGIKTFHASTLIVSRAGASACAEIFALQKPSILIPSPYVPNDHQTKNALAALNAKACYLLREGDANATVLDNTIAQLIQDSKQLDKMSNACASLRYENSVDDMIDIALKEMNHGRNY